MSISEEVIAENRVVEETLEDNREETGGAQIVDSSGYSSGDGAVWDLCERLEFIFVWDGTEASAHCASLFSVIEDIEAGVMYAAVTLRAVEMTGVDAEGKRVLRCLEMTGDAALCDRFLCTAWCSGTGSISTF